LRDDRPLVVKEKGKSAVLVPRKAEVYPCTEFQFCADAAGGKRTPESVTDRNKNRSRDFRAERRPHLREKLGSDNPETGSPEALGEGRFVVVSSTMFTAPMGRTRTGRNY
ncbi:MAG: hypothetical protein KGR25_09610, partial [Chloroflexi bacterium]|nr:hypothetical protein [Chloroflexota bacterium]